MGLGFFVSFLGSIEFFFLLGFVVWVGVVGRKGL